MLSVVSHATGDQAAVELFAVSGDSSLDFAIAEARADLWRQDTRGNRIVLLVEIGACASRVPKNDNICYGKRVCAFGGE